MNIVVISYIYPKRINPSQGLYIHQQAKYLAKLGHNVDVITTRSHSDKEEETVENVNIHRVSMHIGAGKREFHKVDPKPAGFIFLVNSLRKIFELKKEEGIDLIIGQFIGISTIVFGMASRLMGIKFVAVSHGTGWELPKKNRLQNFLIRLALSFPDKIVCVSNKTKELLSHNTDQRKLFVINNGMDPEYLAPSKSRQQFKKELRIKNELIILSVANLVGKKGVDIVIRAVSNVVKKYPNMIYLIVGDGVDKEKLENLVKELNLEKKIRFEGRKIGSELANYYNVCDLFALMSQDVESGIESFGIVYIEASYFGKAVIAGASGGTRDAVLDGKTGLLVNPSDEKILEKTILMLLKNKKLRYKLGKAGKARVLQGFLWKNNAKKLVELASQ